MAALSYADAEAREMLSATDSDSQPTRRSSRALKVGGVVSAALALAGGAAWLGMRHGAAPVDVEGATQLATVASQNNWTITLKERDLCSTAKENCFTTKCCKVASQKCILEKPGMAKCAPYCKPGKPCTVLSETMSFDVKEHSSMYCFAVWTKNTGSTKKSYEKELLAGVYKQKASLFACDAYGVFSDTDEAITDGLVPTKVTDVDNDFHFAKRKESGTWTNGGMFMQVWKAVSAAGDYLAYDWTVKVDADAVFFPAKLKARIHLMPVPAGGAFLQNCEKVDYGFFGNLEVFSKTAFSILVANIDVCKHKTVANWKVGIKNGKYGPMGEDLFAQICMEKNGVAKLDAFDITKDGACEAKRPENLKKFKKWKADCSQTSTPAIHPFKKPKEYFACMKAAAPL